MPDDPNIPPNTQTPDSSLIIPSDILETAPEAQNAPMDGFTPESPNKPLDMVDAGMAEAENEPKAPEIPLEPTDPQASPASNGTSPENRTAQIPVNEPLTSEPEVQPEPLKSGTEILSQPKVSLARELLISARNAIQFRKKKKLDRVMTLFLKQSKITNDEVREFLHVSDATAERYLNTLEKENKIKQVGKTGTGVSYSRI